MTVLYREIVETDAFGQASPPVVRVAAMGVFTNPFAGRFVEDLTPLFDLGRSVGGRLAKEALATLANPAVSYGKAALVGVDGDMEHGGAVIHPKLGAAMRDAVGGGAALIPSNAKVSHAGAPIDIPIGHKDEAWSFDHFDTITTMIADAPRPDEIVLCVAYADGGRLNPRCGSGPIVD